MRDDTLMVTVPAKLLNELSAVAGGYTQSSGRWLNPNVIMREASDILYDAGYEYGWDTETLPFDV